ncbi:FtsK/SpoIIIE domain-containing protein [Rhodoglobus sp. NPDC076762]
MNETPVAASRLVLPAAPQQPAPFRFPVIAAIVPVIASLAIWLISGSTFALIFAALGPLAAIGSYVDSRVAARKLRRAERRRFEADEEATRRDIRTKQRQELAELAERSPSAVVLVTDVHVDASRWTRKPNDVLPVHLGQGTVRSTIVFDRTGASATLSPEVERSYSELLQQAEYLNAAPIAVNARLGIAIYGNHLMAISLARSLTIQLARTIAPTSGWVRVSGCFADEAWAGLLPHRQLRDAALPISQDESFSKSGERGSVQWGVLGDEEPQAAITVVATERDVPSGHRIVIRMSAPRVSVVRHPDRHQRRDFVPSFLGREQALEWVQAARKIAARDGLASGDHGLPASLSFGEVQKLAAAIAPSQRDHRRSLPAWPAATGKGALYLDLVEMGPHAIIGGTTGSGKSELLISWVLSMALESSPHDVTFLLVDFKGGSTFGALAELPHTVGIITDLDETTAARAFASLRAELKHRERTLARSKVRDIAELQEMPRLVIVVDEFAAMMGEYPQLHAVFSDIAARGRSLGVHLILCTQRPSGVVRDTLLANADLRVSLRVNNTADSTAVIGSDSAAALSPEARGRAWVAHGSSSAELAQFALAIDRDIQSTAEKWPMTERPRRPWREPLADCIYYSSLQECVIDPANEHQPAHAADKTLVFGLSDLPEEQRHGLATWAPSKDGHVLILGAAGAGKTSALAAFAHAGETRVQVIGDEPAMLWDAVEKLIAVLDSPRPLGEKSVARYVVVDDCDIVLARMDEEYRLVAVERLSRVLREGPSRHMWVVMTAQRITPALQALAQLMPSVLRLRMSSRQEFVLSGGGTETFCENLPAGGGVWKTKRIQVAFGVDQLPVPEPATRLSLDDDEDVVIVSGRPSTTAAQFESAGWNVKWVDGAPGNEHSLLLSASGEGCRTALIGSVDEWQSRWGAIQALRNHTAVIIDACSLADYRQLTRSRELPPPLSSNANECWRLSRSGRAERVQLPRAAQR